MFVLGVREAWGFWSTTALWFAAVVYIAASASNLTFEAIAIRWRKKRGRQTEAELRTEIVALKAKLYDSEGTRKTVAAECDRLLKRVRELEAHARASLGGSA